jgi:predicted MFS family arabinose efflux permease
MAKERTIVFLVGSVQFINILDFMMVMPLGPDFSKALDIPVSHLGYIAGSYTASAAVSGIICSFFLDRFDRRRALAVAMLGLVIGTAMGGFATGMVSLMVARVIAGAFGGPATSIALAIIADVIPPERRGKAMGAVMGSFALASVLGVPAGLELATRGTWRTPFFAVAALGFVVCAGATFFLPPLKIHLEAAKNYLKRTTIADLFTRPIIVVSYLTSVVVMGGMFVLVPNISTYIQQNLGYPRESIGMLYLLGGIVSFATTRLVGGVVDKIGANIVGAVGACCVAVVTYLSFYRYPPAIPVLAMFIGLMFATSLRGVPYNTLISRVPLAHERARYMSILSAVQHISSALAGFLSASVLHELDDHSLAGMQTVSVMAIVLALSQVPLLFLLQKMILRRDAQSAPVMPAPVLTE